MRREALGRRGGELTSQYGMRSLRAEEVAEGLGRAVVSASPGSALLIYPGLSFYWPDTSLAMFNLYRLASLMLVWVMGRPSVPVETGQIAGLLVSGLVVVIYLSHLLLGWLGL